MVNFSLPSLNVEQIIWWSTAVFVTAGRYVSRVKQRGWGGLDLSDALMAVAVVLYTASMLCLNFTIREYYKMDPSIFTPQGFTHLTDTERKHWELAEKLWFVAELTNLTCEFLVKICLSFLYHKLTVNRRSNLLNKIAAGYAVLSYVIMITLFLTAWCRPLHRYWEPSLANTSCHTYFEHNITVLAFTTSSSIFILLVPVPMLLNCHFSHLRKTVLVSIFGLGIFSLGTSIYCRATVIEWQVQRNEGKQPDINAQWPLWLAREISAIVIVGNLYYWWPLLRRLEKWRGGMRLRLSSSSCQKANSEQIESAAIDGVQEVESGPDNTPMVETKNEQGDWRGYWEASGNRSDRMPELKTYGVLPD